MHKVYIAAAVTTFLVIFFYVSYIWRIGKRNDYSRLFTTLLIALPLSFWAFYALRQPLDRLIQLVVSSESVIYKFISILYAPLTEEPVKLIPLLIPFIYNRINKENFVSFGMAMGVGFGMGEIWLTTIRSNQIPGELFLPFGYMLLGFISEWLMVCLLHGAFTSLVLSRLRRGWGWGLAGAIGLHFLANLPLNLVEMKIIKLDYRVMRAYLPLYLIFFFVLMILMLTFLRAGKQGLLQIFTGARIECSECKASYKRSYLKTHLSTKKSEECPNCGEMNSIEFKEKP